MHENGRIHLTEEQLVGRLGELISDEFPLLSELVLLEPEERLLAGADRFHGPEHAAGVASWQKLLQKLPRYRDYQFASKEMDVASIGHDVGRIGYKNQEGHGLRSAEKIYDTLDAMKCYSAEDIDIDLAKRLMMGHSPGAPADPHLPPYHQELFKEADKIELARVERIRQLENPGRNWKIDEAKLVLPESSEIFIPLAYAIYERIDRIKQMTGVNGYKAYLLAEVELGIVRPDWQSFDLFAKDVQ